MNLGLAIDLPGKNGQRSLVVVSIKGSETMNFAQFWCAYEDIVRKARAGALTAEDYAGTTISPDQPGQHRHQPLGAPADAGPERDHRRRRDGVPGLVPGRQRPDAGRARHQQDHHADLDLRPPGHPGRRVRRVPAPDPPAAARRGRLLRRRLHLAAAAVRAGALGPGPRRRPDGAGRQDRPGAGDHRRLPHPRPPDGRHRPAELPAAPAPRPGRALPRPDPVGPGPGVPGRRVQRPASS